MARQRPARGDLLSLALIAVVALPGPLLAFNAGHAPLYVVLLFFSSAALVAIAASAVAGSRAPSHSLSQWPLETRTIEP